MGDATALQTKAAFEPRQPCCRRMPISWSERYKAIGEMEGHKFGEGNVPNFNVPIRRAVKAARRPRHRA